MKMALGEGGVRAICALASAAFLAGTAAVADPGTPAQDPILAYYPPAALERGVDGAVILSCARTQHGGFADCRVSLEGPTGDGFGEAAMALAANAVECSTVTLPPESRTRRYYYFGFSASSATIAPNVLKPDWPILQGKWLRRPTGDDMALAYPDRAAEEDRNGRATMVCATDKTGGLHDCTIAGESPAGYDFGKADLELARHFEIDPSRDCAGMTVESTIVIPVAWVPPGGGH